MEAMSFVLRGKPTAATPPGGLGSHGFLHPGPRAEAWWKSGRLFSGEGWGRRMVACGGLGREGRRREMFAPFLLTLDIHSKT